MNALLWCLIVVTFLPMALGVFNFNFRKQQFGMADNKLPRLQQQQLTGIGARALGAHQNAWEALAMFAPIVFIVEFVGVDPVKAGLTGIIFVVLRLLHAIFYIADLDKLRSAAYLLGVICLIRLIVLAA